MVLVALAFLVFAALRRLPWRYVGLGALAWILTVALKFAWAIPVNGPLFRALENTLPKSVADPIFYVYVGALTGIFEVGIVWLMVRYKGWGQPITWAKALAFGIGFGVVEALLLGLSSLVAVTNFMVSPDAALQNPEALAHLNNVLFGLAPISERFFTVLIHVAANLLIFYSVLRREARWFWLAFIYKTAFDAIATFAQFWGVDTLSHLWTIEAIVALFGIIGWLVWWILRPRFPATPMTRCLTIANSQP